MEPNFQPEIGQNGFEEFEKEVSFVDADNWARFINYVVDRVISTLFALLLFMLVAYIFEGFQNYLENISKLEDWFLTSLMMMFYYLIFEIISRRTIGKYLTKTKVVPEAGYELDFRRILIRSLCRFIPLDAISIFFGEGRAWHDRISKTRVVKIVK